MRSSGSQCLFALISLTNLTSAIPVSWPKVDLVLRAPQPQSYSVVAVDGGSSSTSSATSTDSAATKTVTDAVTQTYTSVLLSTIVATPTNSDSTVPQTVTLATTIIQTPSGATAAATGGSATATPEPSVTSIPYDNGQWKTTYYFRSTVASVGDTDANTDIAAATTSLAFSAAATTPPVSVTTSIDPGQWAAWANKDTSGAYTAS